MKPFTSRRRQRVRPALIAALGVAPLAASPVYIDAPASRFEPSTTVRSSPVSAGSQVGIPDHGVWQVLWNRGVPLTPTWTATVDVDDGLQLCIRLALD